MMVAAVWLEEWEWEVCSGYHVCLTRRRSPVRNWAEPRCLAPRPYHALTAAGAGRWVMPPLCHPPASAIALYKKVMKGGGEHTHEATPLTTATEARHKARVQLT